MPSCGYRHKASGGGTGATVGQQGQQSGEELDAEQRRARADGTCRRLCVCLPVSDHDDLW